MSFMITGEVVANRQLDLSSVVITEILVEVVPDNIALYTGADVELRRQMEIVTGWEFLWAGVRDRNLLDVGNPFNGSILFTGTDIDKKGENDRRTESLIASLTDNDVILGIGLAATAEFGGATEHLQSAFTHLIQKAREDVLFKAA